MSKLPTREESEPIQPTPEESARVEEMQAALHAHGYVTIGEHGRLRPGARICHRGQQWVGARQNGTGVVLVLMERPDSPWSQSNHMPDIEMIVLWDEQRFGSRLSQLAQYHVSVVEEQPDHV